MRNTDNMELKTYILNNLKKVESTDTYVFGIREEKMVKACIVENASDILPLVTVCEAVASSKGTGFKVRMWNSNEAFKIIREYARETITLCSVAEFEAGFKAWRASGNNGNRGNYFEPTFCGVTGAEMNTNPIAKCTECGDVRLNGEELQLKLWNATVISQEQVERFMERA